MRFWPAEFQEQMTLDNDFIVKSILEIPLIALNDVLKWLALLLRWFSRSSYDSGVKFSALVCLVLLWQVSTWTEIVTNQRSPRRSDELQLNLIVRPTNTVSTYFKYIRLMFSIAVSNTSSASFPVAFDLLKSAIYNWSSVPRFPSSITRLIRCHLNCRAPIPALRRTVFTTHLSFYPFPYALVLNGLERPWWSVTPAEAAHEKRTKTRCA